MVVIPFFLANLIGETAPTLELTSYLQTSLILYVKSQSTPSNYATPSSYPSISIFCKLDKNHPM
jgi:hypothetical protein